MIFLIAVFALGIIFLILIVSTGFLAWFATLSKKWKISIAIMGFVIVVGSILLDFLWFLYGRQIHEWLIISN